MRILIADDDALSRLLLRKALEKLGHTVMSVENGLDAVEALTQPGGPQMAVLDWMMPGADGLAVCREVRKQESSYVYLLLLTARDGENDLVEALDAGADDFLNKPLNVPELHARLRSGQRVLVLQERLLQATEKLRLEAARDHLTGLWNRGMITELLQREMRRARQEMHPVCVLLADVDHFKHVNDTHGHAAGDEVLRITAQRMRVSLRDYDFLGRYGGEEFLTVLPRCEFEKAIEVANRLRAAVSRQPVLLPNGVEVRITISVGASCALDCSGDAADLVAAADKALYQAKALGRDRVERGGLITAS